MRFSTLQFYAGLRYCACPDNASLLAKDPGGYFTLSPVTYRMCIRLKTVAHRFSMFMSLLRNRFFRVNDGIPIREYVLTMASILGTISSATRQRVPGELSAAGILLSLNKIYKLA